METFIPGYLSLLDGCSLIDSAECKNTKLKSGTSSRVSSDPIVSSFKQPSPLSSEPCSKTDFVRDILKHRKLEQIQTAKWRSPAIALAAKTFHISMTMDEGQIGKVELFMAILLASNISDCFTHSITETDILDHVTFARFLEPRLTSRHQREIQIASIICDDADYPLNAFDLQESASIQVRNSANSLFARLLYILCLCHRSH
jgi:hypothetical protein